MSDVEGKKKLKKTNGTEKCGTEHSFPFFLAARRTICAPFHKQWHETVVIGSSFCVRKFSDSVHFTTDVFLKFSPFLCIQFFFLSVRFGSFANFKLCSKTLNDSNDNTKRNKMKQRLCDMHKYNLLKCYFYRC